MAEFDREKFTQACAYIMPFGKHRHKTLARIGANKDGLEYLDYLIGEPWLSDPARGYIKTYLSHPDIARQLDILTED
jgi:hypothetical protein